MHTPVQPAGLVASNGLIGILTCYPAETRHGGGTLITCCLRLCFDARWYRQPIRTLNALSRRESAQYMNPSGGLDALTAHACRISTLLMMVSTISCWMWSGGHMAARAGLAIYFFVN